MNYMYWKYDIGAYNCRQYRIILIVIYYLIYRLICVIFIILDVYYDSLDAGKWSMYETG